MPMRDILKKIPILRSVLKHTKTKHFTVIIYAVVFVLFTFVYASYMANKQIEINSTAHAPLLDLIARAESNDNYNAYFSNPQNRTIEFTTMTIAEVLNWQKEFVAQGSPSSAVGRYQIINTTLKGLVRQLSIDSSQKFDKPMQDRLAVALLERRGVKAYVNNEITRYEFAANIAKEWAALPRVFGDNPQDSYYASDGLNRSRVDVNKVLDVIKKAYS